MKKLFLPVAVLLSFGISISTAQNYWNVLLHDGNVYSNVELIKVKSDSLVISQFGMYDTIPVESVFQLRQIKESTFWNGAAWGGGIGFSIGFAIGAISAHGSDVTMSTNTFGDITLFETNQTELKILAGLGAGIIGGVIGALVGGGITSMSGDTVYDISKMNPREKTWSMIALLDKQQ